MKFYELAFQTLVRWWLEPAGSFVVLINKTQSSFSSQEVKLHSLISRWCSLNVFPCFLIFPPLLVLLPFQGMRGGTILYLRADKRCSPCRACELKTDFCLQGITASCFEIWNGTEKNSKSSDWWRRCLLRDLFWSTEVSGDDSLWTQLLHKLH